MSQVQQDNRINQILNNKRQDLETFNKELEKLYHFVIQGLIYLRKEHEKALVYVVESYIEQTLVIIQMINNQQNQQREQEKKIYIDQRKQRVKNIIQTIQKEILNQNLSKHLILLEQDLDIMIQNPRMTQQESEKRFLFRKKKIEMGQLAYQQLFNYLDLYKLNKIHDILKSQIVSSDKTKSLSEEYSFLEKRMQQYLGENEQLLKKQKIDVLRNGYELSFWRKVDIAVKEKTQHDPKLYQRTWDSLTGPQQDQDENPNKKYEFPIMKAKDNINLIQQFMDRKMLSDTKRPNIINIKVDDNEQNITVIQMTSRGNMLLAGTSTGQVLQFILNSVPQKHQQQQQMEQQQQQQQGKKQSIFQMEEIDNNDKYDPEHNMQYCHKYLAHSGAITAISILYDELYFLTTSTDNIIKLWCIRSKQCLTVYKMHQKTIWDVQFAPLGYFFVSASADKTAVVWTTDKVQPQLVLTGHQSDVVFAQFSPDLQVIYTGGLDFTVRIFKWWDKGQGGDSDNDDDDDDNSRSKKDTKVECLKIFVIDFQISARSLSFDASLLCLGGATGEIQVIDLINQQLGEKIYFEVEGKRHQIVDMEFNMDQSEIAVASLKSFASYTVDSLLDTGAVDIYEEYYTGKKQYDEKKQNNRFIHAQPIDLVDIQGIRKETFFKIAYNPKNYIVLVSK